MIFCLESTTACMSEWSFFSSSSTDISLQTAAELFEAERAEMNVSSSSPSSPADDALHLEVLVVLLPPQTLL